MKILDKYPVENEQQIKEASRYFNEHLVKFHPNERVKIAMGMHVACISKKIPIEKNASYNNYFNHCTDGKVDRNYFEQSINDRKALVHGMEFDVENSKIASCGKPHGYHETKIKKKSTNGATKIATEVLDEILSFSGKHSISKIAEILIDFDTTTGINEEWDNKIKDPYLSVSSNFNGIDKNSFQKIAGTEFDFIDLHNLSCDDEFIKSAKKCIDEDICDSFVKSPFKFVKEASPVVKKVFFEQASKVR